MPIHTDDVSSILCMLQNVSAHAWEISNVYNNISSNLTKIIRKQSEIFEWIGFEFG